nr:unnamed protein product [Digitaria exilis]
MLLPVISLFFYAATPDSPRESRGKSSRGRGKAGYSSGSDDPSDDLGEDDDALNQMNTTRESTVGISRLSRVSSQFLPPDASRKVQVPLGNYDLRYSFLSQRGYYPESLDKANQDSYCIHTPFGTSPDDHFFGVFDGHGEYGAQCSQFVKRRLCENLLRDYRFRTDAVLALHSAFVATNSQLHADTLDDSMSGTTAITILVRGKTIYVANTGDSRAVIAEKRGDDIVAVDLSIDQTPYRLDELERVKECGARVLTLDQIEGLKNPDVQCWGTEESDDGDPPRLWVQNGMYPGTAFTRSLGDSVAESIGVIADPEIFVLDLNSKNPFFVLASDGVFEFLSSQTVVDMAHIERVLHDHFLFRKLTDSQCHVLLDCMQRVEVKPGDIVVQQGGEGDCFYVVGSGEYEVLAIQNDDVSALYVIRRGRVRLILAADQMNSDTWDLISAQTKQAQSILENVGDVTCSTITKESFDTIIGPLPKLSQADSRIKESLVTKENVADDDFPYRRVQLSNLEWKMCIYAAECSEIGLVKVKGTASVVVALEGLHQKSILYRGVSADTLMLDRSGHLQLVDFRFAKKMEGERTYTICGIADSLAPEIVLGRGHGYPADWWALGVLIYFMLQSDMPFGSWRESELEPVTKIAKGHLVMPSTFSAEVCDLITKLLVVDENVRLGTSGAEAVKKHLWFDGIEWEQIASRTYAVPDEITERISSCIETLNEDLTASPSVPIEDPDNLTAPEWIQDW